MAFEPFSYEDFEQTRERLITEINQLLNDQEREFLRGFKANTPNWKLMPISNLQELPAIKWKLHNISKLQSEQPEKHADMLGKLEQTLAA